MGEAHLAALRDWLHLALSSELLLEDSGDPMYAEDGKASTLPAVLSLWPHNWDIFISCLRFCLGCGRGQELSRRERKVGAALGMDGPYLPNIGLSWVEMRSQAGYQ